MADGDCINARRMHPLTEVKSEQPGGKSRIEHAKWWTILERVAFHRFAIRAIKSPSIASNMIASERIWLRTFTQYSSSYALSRQLYSVDMCCHHREILSYFYSINDRNMRLSIYVWWDTHTYKVNRFNKSSDTLRKFFQRSFYIFIYL